MENLFNGLKNNLNQCKLLINLLLKNTLHYCIKMFTSFLNMVHEKTVMNYTGGTTSETNTMFIQNLIG